MPAYPRFFGTTRAVTATPAAMSPRSQRRSYRGNQLSTGRMRASLRPPRAARGSVAADMTALNVVGRPVHGQGCVPVYGARGTRTPDLLGAIQALSQLSYSPEEGDSLARRR